ncbi:hypothetical protein [Nitrospira sp. Nam74]
MISHVLADPVAAQEGRSVDEYLVGLLREKGAQTLDHLGQSLPNVNWPRLFLAIDRLSRAGRIAISLPQQGDYLISLSSDPSACLAPH